MVVKCRHYRQWLCKLIIKLKPKVIHSHNLAPSKEHLLCFTVIRALVLVSVVWTVGTAYNRALLYTSSHLCVQRYPVNSLKSATVGVFTPQKWSDATG